ncbi:MAG: oligosaccharide flippase family protein [Lachnospiraceae bacterium]|nr:oligosaccharide flippase family protein [Lachnospiraceae bacterium]
MIKKGIEKYKSLSREVKASFWFLVCGFLQRGISLITTPIFSRVLSTAEYGDFSVFNTWTNVISIFATLNVAGGVFTRGLIKYEDDKDHFTGSLESLLMLCTGICFVIYMLFQEQWNSFFELSSPFMYAMFIEILVAAAFHFWSAQQRVEVKYVRLVIFTLLNAILRPTVGVIAVLSFPEHRLEARIYSMILVDVLTFGGFFLGFFKNGLKTLTTKYWKYALAFNLPLVPHYLSQTVLNQSDRVMIKSMVGSSEAGIYSLAYSLASLMLILNTAVINTLTPWMYKRIRQKDYVAVGTKTVPILLLVAFANFTLTAFAPEAIRILAPSSYYEAIWIIPPVAASTYFIFMYSLFSNFEFYYDQTKFMMVASVLGACTNVVLNYIFIGIYGYYAAGYTTLFCYILYCVGHYLVMRWVSRKYMDGEKVYNMKLIVGSSVVFVALCGLMMGAYNHVLVRILLYVAVCAVFVAKRNEFVRILAEMRNAKHEEV